MSALPVVVVGAGPIGLAAAAELRERGLTPLVFERGPVAGAAVAEWNHVRLFSRWEELIDPAARRLLEAAGWAAPDDDAYPTGQDWAENYLQPLASALGDVVQLGTEVIGVARRGRDRVVDAGRDTEPLSVHLRRSGGTEDRIIAQAVIDASGTWGTPNPLGGEGLPALGEKAAADRISTGSRTSRTRTRGPATEESTPSSPAVATGADRDRRVGQSGEAGPGHPHHVGVAPR